MTKSTVVNETEATVVDEKEVVQAKEVAEVKEAASNETAIATQQDIPMGFEDDNPEDMIIPRVKVIQTLSPERKDKIAEEGDILNSLTKEKINGKIFIPVFKFNNNIEWRPRNDGGGIVCQARDAKLGEKSDGTRMLCISCKRCEFDNTKQGSDAAPKCTKYINFFGFFAGERMPIILSFAKTNYNEGKKVYSLAKVTMQNMWNYGYRLDEKLISKNGNEWYNIVGTPAGATSVEDRDFGLSLYKQFRANVTSLNIDLEDSNAAAAEQAPVVDVDKVEY